MIRVRNIVADVSIVALEPLVIANVDVVTDVPINFSHFQLVTFFRICIVFIAI